MYVEWLLLSGKLKPLTGRSSPRLHSEILQSFGISVKLFQFIQSIHFLSQKTTARHEWYRQIPALLTHISPTLSLPGHTRGTARPITAGRVNESERTENKRRNKQKKQTNKIKEETRYHENQNTKHECQ